jgi:hypothetical protein
MNRVHLQPQQHSVKIGEQCPYIEPNVTDDSLFYADGKLIGFYLKQMPEKMCKLADIANAEFRSSRVKKQAINRVNMKEELVEGVVVRSDRYAKSQRERVKQLSAQVGSVPPKAHFGRPYASKMQIHSERSADKFVKALLLLAKEGEQVIRDIMPEQYVTQLSAMEEVDKEWRFGNLFTGGICNYNIAAAFHQDKLNLPNSVNIIICKRLNSKGGDLHVPDYGATIGQVDNSMLVYPAWRNVHGVTPIIPTHEGGYRNSLVFYPLKAFVGLP